MSCYLNFYAKVKGNLDFLETIILDCEENFNSFEGIYCNIL